MPVEPGGHRQARPATRERLQHGETGAKVGVGAMEVGLLCEEPDCVVDRVVAVRREPRPEVGGLHCPGPTSGCDVPPLAGHRSAEFHDGSVPGIAPQHRVPAHHGHHVRTPVEVFGEGIVDRVIVESRRQCVEHRHIGSSPMSGGPAIDRRVERIAIERTVIARRPAGEQVTLGIQPGPIRVEGQVGQAREDHRTGTQDVVERRSTQPRSKKGGTGARQGLDDV